jgi:hypothetical protein
MPIKGEYSCTEQKDQLKLVIPLKGVSPSKIDIFGKVLFQVVFVFFKLICLYSVWKCIES